MKKCKQCRIKLRKDVKGSFCIKHYKVTAETRAKIGFKSKNRAHSEEQKETIKNKKKLTFALKQGFSSIREWEINRHIKRNLRSRLNKAIVHDWKTGSAVNDLGCSLKEFKTYIEKQFQKDMNWENYGKWHIDHIKPLCKFDLRNLKEFKEACHYSNLQPLWAEDNLKKRLLDGSMTKKYDKITI